MQRKTSPAIIVILVALALGVVTDQLMKGGPWGVNIILLCLLFLAVVAGLSRVFSHPLTGGGRGFAIPLALFGALFSLRDSAALSFFNGLALIGCLCLFVARSATGRVLIGSISQRAIDVLRSVFSALMGGLALLPQLRGANSGTRLQNSVLLRILLGLLLAVPLLLVFGVLFASADAGFEKMLRDLFDFNISTIVERVLTSLGLAWLCAGLLWLLLEAIAIPLLKVLRPGFRYLAWWRLA